MGRSAIVLPASSLLWTLIVAYTITSFYTKISQLRPYLGNDLFSSSWIPGFPERDTSDDEWKAFLDLLKSLVPAILLQNVSLHALPKDYHVVARVVVSSVFLLTMFGVRCTLFIFGMFLVTFGLQRLRFLAGGSTVLKMLIYGINLSTVYVGVYDSQRIQNLMGNPLEDTNYLLLFEVCVAWSAIRAISCGVTSNDGESPSLMCCYYLYLPCLVLGPVTNYRTFANQIRMNHIPPVKDSITQACISMFRVVLWFVVMEVMLHTVWPMATRFDFHIVRGEFHPVEYFGYSAILMAHFYVKYLIIYGIAEEAARIEGLWLPERPRCTLRLHSGAEVWRTFDRGLYLWFLELIYIPLGGSFLASLLCFVFVCFWHSFSIEVQIWCGLNFVLVVVEKLLSKQFMFVQVILQCPLHWLAVGSNMFYLGGPEVGLDFFWKLLEAETLGFAFLASLVACVLGRHFQNQDKIFYRSNAERFNIKKRTL